MLARLTLVAFLVLMTAVAGTTRAAAAAAAFDHDYGAYAALLRNHTRGSRVDYARLKANRRLLDSIVEQLGAVEARDEANWSREQRLAFWINAYNVFTLSAIVDHYPIQGSWLSLYPRSSIRQIDGVWTGLLWKAAGRRVTLDQIEREILRRELREPLIHFAVNCASVSCPPLAPEPYRAATLVQQLDTAARRYFASSLGLVVEGRTLRFSSIFKWYGDDFVERFATSGPDSRSAPDRALLGLVIAYGPPPAVAVARSEPTSIAFLYYDWSLNDISESAR